MTVPFITQVTSPRYGKLFLEWAEEERHPRLASAGPSESAHCQRPLVRKARRQRYRVKPLAADLMDAIQATGGSTLTEHENPIEEKGFVASLFDLQFESFVALRFIRVIYLVSMIFIGLGAVGLFVAGISDGNFLTAFGALAFLFVYLILIRVWLEVIAMLFRIGENTTAMKEMMESRG